MRIHNPTNVTCRDPRAHPLVWRGNRGERLQVSVLEDDLIRVEHWPEGKPRLDRTWMIVGRDGEGPREGRSRSDLSPFSLPSFALDARPERFHLQTAKLQLEITPGDFTISWADAEGREFAGDAGGRAYAYDRQGRTLYHYLQRRVGEHYYGFGERAGPLDKAGMRMRMLNLDALGYNAAATDPLYKHVPFYITWNPDLGIAYGLLYDNLATSVFDMGCEIDAYHGAYRYYQAEDGDLDYYLLFGPSIAEVVTKLARLIGRISLPPRWSLGYLGSSMARTEADDAQAQLAEFVALCAQHEIPCDLYHLSSGYSTAADGQRYVFTWNRDKVPDPVEMAETFHRAGIKLAANIKPCLLQTHPRYDEVAAQGAFVRAAEAEEPELSMFWGGNGSYLDLTNPAAYDWWKRNVREQLLEVGIDATWNDNNEYEIWDDEARCNGFGKGLRAGLIRPLFSLLMARASYEAQREFKPFLRPLLISRSGAPGIQRYAQTWSGDNSTSWNTLRYNIPMGLGLGLSGMPNLGHDVGGFTGFQPSPELFIRWVQNGTFHPRFTIHSWHLDGTVNEPWMYPEILPIVREAIRFRYRLIPYLYSLLFHAAQTGEPVLRPLVYTFPHDPRCQTESFDFMLGPNLLVASVLEDGARTRTVYLPGEGEWCDFYTGAWYPGGSEVTVPAPLDRIPLFVPSNGMIPMGKAMRHVGAEPDDWRQVLVFPSRLQGEESFLLTEDDGVSMDYAGGGFSQVRLGVRASPDQVSLSAVLAHAGYPLPYRTVEFVLPPGDLRPAAAEGGEATRRDEQGRLHVVVPVRGES